PPIKVTVTVEKDKKTEDWVYLIGKETDEKNSYYAKQGGHDLVFIIKDASSKEVHPFMRPKDVNDFVLKWLQGDLQDLTVVKFDRDKVKGIKLVGFKEAMKFVATLEMENKGQQNWVAKSPPDLDLDPNQAIALVQYLANLKADRFVVQKIGPKPEYKLGEKERALYIQITVEGEKNPITLTIGNPDDK